MVVSGISQAIVIMTIMKATLRASWLQTSNGVQDSKYGFNNNI